MDGVPVYLASMSRRHPQTGEIIPTGKWSASMRAYGEGVLRRAIGKHGDVRRERLFRMNVTLCRHRALTDAEVAALPAWFHDADAIDIAGGPVEVLWESVPGRPSTQPWRRPNRVVMIPSRPDLWIPEDCGHCDPCLGRANVGVPA